LDYGNNICSFSIKHIENKMIQILSGERKVSKREDRIFNRKISVLGMARSGIAVAQLLSRKGAEVFVSELKPEKELENQIAQLKTLYIDFEVGAHTDKILEDKDFIVISPGIPPDIPILKKAEDLGIPIFSEIEIAFWLSQSTIVAITGSNGKTTTTYLVGEILRQDQKECRVAGNVGVPFSSVVEEVSERGIIVLEVSSFQLEKVEEFRPKVATILNITPDHLDRYPDLKSYQEAKLRLFENQTEEDFAVLNADDPISPSFSSYAQARKIYFSTKKDVEEGVSVRGENLVLKNKNGEMEIISIKDIAIKGPHNLSNAAAACAMAFALEIDTSSMARALKEFKGVEHRLEYVATIDSIRFINDSKATNVDSVWYALQSIDEPIILIAGGKDKGGDFTKLRELVKSKVKKLILIGQAKEKIKKALGDLVDTVEAETLEQAIKLGFEKGQPGDTVLLSPACASFDMFKDFEDRGKKFKLAVHTLR
jgi:UDP-N-acetylmuramoylalanine--D-glutamate ligase